MTERRDELEPTQSDSIALLMSSLNLTKQDRPVVNPALDMEKRTKNPAAAIELPDGRIITGKTSPLLGACSAMLLDSLKALAGIDPDVKLLAIETIEPIQTLKTEHLGSQNPRLHTDEVLIALSVNLLGDWLRDSLNPRLRCIAIPFLPMSTPCLLYTSPSPRYRTRSRMPSSA